MTKVFSTLILILAIGTHAHADNNGPHKPWNATEVGAISKALWKLAFQVTSQTDFEAREDDRQCKIAAYYYGEFERSIVAYRIGLKKRPTLEGTLNNYVSFLIDYRDSKLYGYYCPFFTADLKTKIENMNKLAEEIKDYYPKTGWERSSDGE